MAQKAAAEIVPEPFMGKQRRAHKIDRRAMAMSAAPQSVETRLVSGRRRRRLEEAKLPSDVDLSAAPHVEAPQPRKPPKCKALRGWKGAAAAVGSAVPEKSNDYSRTVILAKADANGVGPVIRKIMARPLGKSNVHPVIKALLDLEGVAPGPIVVLEGMLDDERDSAVDALYNAVVEANLNYFDMHCDLLIAARNLKLCSPSMFISQLDTFKRTFDRIPEIREIQSQRALSHHKKSERVKKQNYDQEPGNLKYLFVVPAERMMKSHPDRSDNWIAREIAKNKQGEIDDCISRFNAWAKAKNITTEEIIESRTHKSLKQMKTKKTPTRTLREAVSTARRKQMKDRSNAGSRSK
jgi:hypothetical protein